MLRAYAKYLRQIGFPLSQSFIESTLAANAGIAAGLVALFKARFDPDAEAAGDGEAAARMRAVEDALEAVDNLSEDRVLRQFLALILATTRTNFWRRDAEGRPRSFLSFKFDPSKVPGLPEPRPMFEIFVYSPRFEGVHMRGGRVARGGLRWSDRPEDFRTEILGLVKAQMVKNVVIVPVGSKGGFVLKRAPSPADRDAYLKEGIACYQDYLRALLDLTDNRVGDRIVPPPQVRRHDPDDPYLVVAADKGTASFSDHANAISREYGFWLGDAFASGGSAGYDHKAMGITARGAWESVKRHFREMGIDTQTTDFTVAGIGDMSGDVFGNGMLLSPHIRLVAAFDHRHVFLDPDPDPESVAPRAGAPVQAAALVVGRLRREAHIGRRRRPSAEREVDRDHPRGQGGARDHRGHADADRARQRDPEGAGRPPVQRRHRHLRQGHDRDARGGRRPRERRAARQRAGTALQGAGRGRQPRLHAARAHRVRALGRAHQHRRHRQFGGSRHVGSRGEHQDPAGPAVADGELTEKQRNALLAEMTDDVAALVLRDNYFQTQVLSVTARIAPELLDAQQRFVQFLEKEGRLNRAIEYLPSDDEFALRRDERPGTHDPGARGSARLRQDVALRRARRLEPAGRSLGRERARPLFPRGARPSATRATWTGIRCGARSSRRT